MDSCEICDKEMIYGGVSLASGNKTESLCTDCFNARAAEKWGIEKPHSDFDLVTLKDFRGETHVFYIHTMLSTGLGLQAIEFENGQPKDFGYKFTILVHPETDSMEAFKMLYEKMKKGLAYQSIVEDEYHFGLNEDDTIIGRIEDCNERDGISFSIDGKEYSPSDLERYMSTCVGFNFKLTIYDMCDDIILDPPQDNTPWLDV